MKLHHIGIATNNLGMLTNEYLSQGYKLVSEVYDPEQKARLRLLSKDKEANIELVFTNDVSSQVFNLSHNNYKKEYHKCYKINDIINSINRLEKDGFLLVSNTKKAVLFSAKICFMYKDGQLIELMEEA